MDAVEFGGDAVLQECRLRLSLDLFFNLAVYQLVALRQSNPLQRIGSRSRTATRARLQLMIRDLIYSLFSFVVFHPFADKCYYVIPAPDTGQIKPGGIPVHRENAHRLQPAKLLQQALIFREVHDTV